MILGQQSNSDIWELNEAQRCYIVEQCNCSVLCIVKVSKHKSEAAKTGRRKLSEAIIFDLQ